MLMVFITYHNLCIYICVTKRFELFQRKALYKYLLLLLLLIYIPNNRIRTVQAGPSKINTSFLLSVTVSSIW